MFVKEIVSGICSEESYFFCQNCSMKISSFPTFVVIFSFKKIQEALQQPQREKLPNHRVLSTNVTYNFLNNNNDISFVKTVQ